MNILKRANCYSSEGPGVLSGPEWQKKRESLWIAKKCDQGESKTT